MISLFKAVFKAVKAAMKVKNRSFYQKSDFIFIVSGMFGQTSTVLRKDSIAAIYERTPLWLKPFGLTRLSLRLKGRPRLKINLYLSIKRRYLNTPI